MLDSIFDYFPSVNPQSRRSFQQIYNIYEEWNEKINVVSRKNFQNFYIHHVLHSLAIAKYVQFKKGTTVLDIGTGGGFPTIPLAILFPEVEFLAVDSIKKKITVVDAAVEHLDLKNVKTHWGRAESVQGEFDFIVSRAVAPLKDLLYWSKGKVHPISFNDIDNGLIALKGGDLKDEIRESKRKVNLIPVSEYFSEDFFETKFLTYIKL